MCTADFLARVVRRCGRGVLFLISPALCSAGTVWEEAWQVKVNGQTISVEMFTSRSSPDVVFRELVNRNRFFDRYVVAQGRILLSGLVDRTHWLAEIQGNPQGTRGYVSALYFRPGAGSILSNTAGGRAMLRRFEFGPDATVSVVPDAHSPAAVSVSVSEY